MKNNKTKEIFVPCKYINDDGTVLDFTGLYEVSDQGRVRSMNYHRTGKAKILSPGIHEGPDGSIFYQVVLRKNNKQYCKKVHRLVLSSFDQEGWSENACVDHIVARTSTSCDDRLSNLRWFTQKENSNTEHCRSAKSKRLTNRKDLSKRVKVTDLSTGEVTEYLSAREADRSLGIPLGTVGVMIKNHDGYYKKRQLCFEYVK